MKKFLLLILVAMVNAVFAGHITEKFLIQFASNEYVLDAVALQKLEEVNAFLLKHPNAKIKLTGRTDYDGSIGYNVILSRNRTTEVAKHLKNKGWQNTEINESWLGEKKPLAENSNENGKSLNRSVEIEITVLHFENVNEWLTEQQSNYKKTYQLKNSAENIITTPYETILTIPANAFVDENGKAIDNKNVKLIITEINNSIDFIINQVFTTSGDKILETGGMLNIEAYNGTNPLQLAKNKEINIQIPTENLKNDMLVFEGIKDQNGYVDWQTKGESFSVKTVSNQTSKKLNEELLERLIKQIELKKPKPVAYDLNYDMPFCKHILKAPREPKKPEKPSAKNSMSGFHYIFSTKKSKDNAIEKAYAKKMDKYEKQKERYQKNLKNYNNLLLVHKDEIKKYDEDKQAFYDWIRYNLELVKNEKEALIEYHHQKRIVMGLGKLLNDSKNNTLFSSSPLKYLINTASLSNFEDKDVITLNYLKGLEYSFSTLKYTNIDEIEKKYSYRKKLRIGTLVKHGITNGMRGEQRNIYNTFLDSFMLANATTFASVFPEEWKDYQAEITNRNNYAKNMAEQAKKYEKANEARNYFSGNSPKLGWINCDRFVNQILVNVKSSYIDGAIQVYILKDMKSYLSTNYDLLNKSNIATLPIGKKFKLLTFKVENNMAYISVQEGNVKKDMMMEPELIKMPIEEANKIIAAL